ncbi:MAG: HTH-type transcriptional activator RhaS [Herbaspirillum frisingense]|uniref:HTH-type transcriptional activator RhaS n=1 Tax=Herbaspirillum frisingense TaxID=92645 RepID=A0A7V8FU08_9BURK|nr:MAG: HTH-type transcriptional activator RhaS [Herbaspirillum frisingense]
MLLTTDLQAHQGRRDDDECAAARARLAARMLGCLPAEGDHDSPVPGLFLYRRDGYCPPASYIYQPSLSLIVQGSKHVILGTQAYEYDTSHFMLTSVDLPTISQVCAASAHYPFLSILLSLDLTAVQEVGGEIDLHGIAAGDTGSGMMLGPVTAGLLDAVARLAALADTPRDIPVMGRMVLREIIYHLLVSPAGAQLRQIAMHDTRGNRIAGVINWLRDHYAEPVRIETLAEMAAMGVSTLHHHFTAITRLSPLQYQKQIRLHEARRLLLTEALDAGTAAFRVGYESVSQFSREYRRLFGNPPMRDIALLRGGRPSDVAELTVFAAKL